MTRIVIAIAALVLFPACGTTEPDLGNVVFEISTGCFPNPAGPYDCMPNQTTVARGDTLLVGHAVVDTADPTGTESQVIIAAPCAIQFEIWHNLEIVGFLPPEPTCPDSTLAQGINAPRILNLTIFPWAVPADYDTGDYELHSVWLEEPRVRRKIEVQVR